MISKLVSALRERRLPWKLRWLKYLRLRRPGASCRLVWACFRDSPDLPAALLQEFGPSFIEETLGACKRAGARPFLAFGTLLGHCREGGFIKHDADIDFGLLEADFEKRQSLATEMTRLGYLTRVHNDQELAFYKPEFPTLFVDFFLFRRKGRSVVYHDSRGSEFYEYDFPAEILDSLIPVKFLGRIDAWVPQGAEQFLEASYGDWRTPKPRFNNVDDHPNIKVVQAPCSLPKHDLR